MRMNEYNILRAGVEDIKRLAEIERKCIPEPWSENAFLSETKKDGSIILKAVNSSGIICGFITADVIFDEVNIYNVAVSSEYRRQGIAKLLLSSLEQAVNNTACNYFLEVRESNVPAISLYKSIGYKQIGMRKNFYSNPCENAVLMKKVLG